MKQLQQELSMSRVEGSRAESNMVDALTAKNAEIESLVKSLDSWKKKAAASEEKLAALQVSSFIALLRNFFIVAMLLLLGPKGNYMLCPSIIYHKSII
jgi:hypothetical protein